MQQLENRDAKKATITIEDKPLAIRPSYAQQEEIDTFDEFVQRFWAKQISEQEFQRFRLQHGVVSITTSIGAALYPTDGDDMRALLTRADTAMYCAKRQGRNAFQCFSRDTSARTSTSQATQSKLRTG